MGWDIHFFNTKKIGEILDNGNGFKIEFPEEGSKHHGENVAFLYVLDEEGEKSGLAIPDVTEKNYSDEWLTYGYTPYGHKIGKFLWELYTQFGILFADTYLEDYYHLCDFCENGEENDALIDYCCAGEMTSMFGEIIDEEHELYKLLRKTSPVYEKLYKKLKEKK